MDESFNNIIDKNALYSKQIKRNKKKPTPIVTITNIKNESEMFDVLNYYFGKDKYKNDGRSYNYIEVKQLYVVKKNKKIEITSNNRYNLTFTVMTYEELKIKILNNILT